MSEEDLTTAYMVGYHKRDDEVAALKVEIERLRSELEEYTLGVQKRDAEIERLHDLLREAHLALGFMPIPTRALHGLRDRIRAALGDKP